MYVKSPVLEKLGSFKGQKQGFGGKNAENERADSTR